MFDIFAKLLSSVATFLFPVFASYKALKGNDPAQLTPWLMYWVVLACALLVESWTEWILVWFPFYSWIRAGTLLYLVLPQTQGARILYQTHIDPFLATHEAEIDHFISSAHDRARTVGFQYLKQAIELIKEHVLGLQPRQQTPPPPSSLYGGTYAQSLLASFNLPARRNGSFGAPATAGDFYGLLSAALGQATSINTTREAQAEDLSASGTLIPPNIRSAEERMSYISTQRERLRVLISALDKEATNISTTASAPVLPATVLSTGDDMGGPLKKTRSESEFERVEREDVGGEESRAPAGGWMPWNWAGKPPSVHAQLPGQSPDEATTARSTGVDAASRS
ncbi:MAG: hypothetical protein M1832_003560 [Thelocarpon impressellum]|nr:MAG: hypothetical protein M1832_003560 [Thelocarpon impressellum]